MIEERKIRMDEIAFEIWWDKNKDDHSLIQEWQSYKMDCDDIGIEPMEYKTWAKEFYSEFQN